MKERPCVGNVICRGFVLELHRKMKKRTYNTTFEVESKYALVSVAKRDMDCE